MVAHSFDEPPAVLKPKGGFLIRVPGVEKPRAEHGHLITTPRKAHMQSKRKADIVFGKRNLRGAG